MLWSQAEKEKLMGDAEKKCWRNHKKICEDDATEYKRKRDFRRVVKN